jgi:hypothetical protein
MFSSSSRNVNRLNSDGSQNVFCISCGEFISKSFIHMSSRAICALCQRVQDGQPLTAEAINAYNQGRLGVENVTLANLPVPDLKVEKKFTLRSLGGGIMQALGLAKPEEKIPESVKLAVQKKRGRIFSNSSILGDMQDIDKQLAKKKEL